MIYVVYFGVALCVLIALYALVSGDAWLKGWDARGKGIGYSEGINAKRLKAFADELEKIAEREK